MIVPWIVPWWVEVLALLEADTASSCLCQTTSKQVESWQVVLRDSHRWNPTVDKDLGSYSWLCSLYVHGMFIFYENELKDHDRIDGSLLASSFPIMMGKQHFRAKWPCQGLRTAMGTMNIATIHDYLYQVPNYTAYDGEAKEHFAESTNDSPNLTQDEFIPWSTW